GWKPRCVAVCYRCCRFMRLMVGLALHCFQNSTWKGFKENFVISSGVTLALKSEG
ncbi:hypothetical protein KI387_010372, partial [Taxus chinensis]